jgi:hypothetical protein
VASKTGRKKAGGARKAPSVKVVKPRVHTPREMSLRAKSHTVEVVLPKAAAPTRQSARGVVAEVRMDRAPAQPGVVFFRPHPPPPRRRTGSATSANSPSASPCASSTSRR